jgi:hypothetical protein
MPIQNYFEQRRREFESASGTLRYLLGSDAEVVPGGMSFLINQLAAVEARVWERMTRPMLFEQLIPVISAGASPGQTEIVYRMRDSVGQGKRIANNADDIPYVDVAYTPRRIPIVRGGAGYHYSTHELRQAALLGTNLPGELSSEAFRAYEEHMNKVALVGENGDLWGLMNHPDVPILPAENGPWTAETDFRDVFTDVNRLLSAIHLATLTNSFANTLLLPPSVWVDWTGVFLETTAETLIEFLNRNNYTTVSGGGDLTVMQVPELETAGEDETRRLVAYDMNPDNLTMHIPMPIQFLPPQPVNLDLKIPGEYYYSGVAIRYPATIRYMDGV